MANQFHGEKILASGGRADGPGNHQYLSISEHADATPIADSRGYHQVLSTDPSQLINNMKSVLAVSRTDHKRSAAISPAEFNTPGHRRHSMKSELPKLGVKSEVLNKISHYMNYPNNKVRQDLTRLATHGYDYAAAHINKQTSLNNIHRNIGKHRKLIKYKRNVEEEDHASKTGEQSNNKSNHQTEKQ